MVNFGSFQLIHMEFLKVNNSPYEVEWGLGPVLSRASGIIRNRKEPVFPLLTKILMPTIGSVQVPGWYLCNGAWRRTWKTECWYVIVKPMKIWEYLWTQCQVKEEPVINWGQELDDLLTKRSCQLWDFFYKGWPCTPLVRILILKPNVAAGYHSLVYDFDREDAQETWWSSLKNQLTSWTLESLPIAIQIQPVIDDSYDHLGCQWFPSPFISGNWPWKKLVLKDRWLQPLSCPSRRR